MRYLHLKGGYIGARIRLPACHSCVLELTLAPACCSLVTPKLLHSIWKRRNRQGEQQEAVKVWEWRLLIEKEGKLLYR